MKYLAIIFMIPFLFSFVGMDNGTMKEEFTVSGVCGMCEKRIEKAALVKGVYTAEWDKYKQKLTVVYKSKKTTSDIILKAVADAGHDNERFKSTEEKYSSLPPCCKYRDNVKVH